MLDTPPTPITENLTAVADFVEADCLKRDDYTISQEDLIRILGIEYEANDECLRDFSGEVFSELGQRSSHAGTRGTQYPYQVEKNGAMLRFLKGRSNQHWTYLFLLMATRLNMKSNRNHAGLDGTQLFEQLCAVVADRFWGGPCAEVESQVFGTGRVAADLDDDEFLPTRLKFGKRVNELCGLIGEGAGFKAKHSDRVTARDGKLDIVVVRRFTDKRDGQLIGFGQCKTGTHWTNDLTKLRPDEFSIKWLRQVPAVSPVRMYFVTDRVTLRWYEHSVDGGILFDRCRILEYCKKLPSRLEKSIAKWAKAAAKNSGIQIR